MAENLKVRATIPQASFLAMPKKFRAFVAGYGSGKTWVGCMGKCMHYLQQPKVNQGYFAPTFPHIRDIFYPTIEEVAHPFGMSVQIREGNKEVHFYSGQNYKGTTICRSMERPESIVGFKIGHALVDELDLLTFEKAQTSWRKIIARMRYKADEFPNLKNGIDVATTPEGFKFTHKMFVEMLEEKPELKNNYGILHASTYDNEINLPDDYIPSLIEAYPEQLIAAYLEGQFVNLQSGTVYYNFDRKTCNSDEVILPGEPLYIGMDFNVEHMAATIYVQRIENKKTIWHVVEEIKEVFDTPEMIRIIQDRYQTGERKHSITIYPDASGQNRKSVGASISDLALLRQARFSVKVKSSNPAVKDRVLSMNKALESGLIKVNIKNAPVTAKCLEKQAYDKNGEPDKKSGFDHQCFGGMQDVFINGIKMKFKDIPVSGFVLCPDGKYHKYINGGIRKDLSRILLITLSNGDTVICTGDHKFLTINGWKKSIDLIGETLCNRELLVELNKNIEGCIITSVGHTFKEKVLDYIVKFMRLIMGIYLKDLSFTIKTKTKRTMQAITLSLCGEENIQPYTVSKKQKCLSRLYSRLLNGIKAKKVENGTKKTTKRIRIVYTKKNILETVFIAAKKLFHICGKYDFAQTTAPQHIEEIVELTTRKGIAQFVEKRLLAISTKQRLRAIKNAPRVLRIEQGALSSVYCLEVPDIGMFEVSGVIASNCDATTYLVAYELPIVKPIINMGFKFAS